MPDRVLVVDDDPVVRELIARVAAQSGNRVLRAETTEQALDLLAAEPVNLVLTDLGMPGTGGLRLLAKLSTLPAAPPVVVVTACDDGAALRAARLLGARRILQKPFPLTELQEAIADALRPSQALPAAA
jgi:two-component system KDP operon response regulator KdpE